MNTDELHPRALIAGLLMGSVSFAIAVAILVLVGAINSTNLEIETGPFVGYLLVVLLAASSVGGSLWGYELSRRGVGIGASWSLVAALGVVGVVFLAPEGPTLDEAYSDPDSNPDRDAAMAMLEAAGVYASEGDHHRALAELMQARMLVHASSSPGDEGYCGFGHSTGDVASQLAEHGGLNEARMAYAIALRFAQDCPDMDEKALLAGREAARARDVFRD